MGLIEAKSRLKNHKFTLTGLEASVPTSEDFTDGTWLVTDLCLGELGINMTDDRIWFRTNNGVVELMTGSSISGLWLRDGDDIRAVENMLTSPLIYPNILPPADDVSTLGNSTNRWSTLFINQRIDFQNRMSIERNGAIKMVLDNNKVVFGGTANSQGSNDISRGTATNAQYGVVTYVGRTTNASPTGLFLDGTFVANGSENFVIATNTTYRCTVEVVCVDEASGKSKEFQAGTGLITNTSGTTAQIGSWTVSAGQGDASLASTSVSMGVSDPVDSVTCRVTGVAATNIRWFVKMSYLRINL